MSRAIFEITQERERQDAKWGEQNHPDGTGDFDQQQYADIAREHTNTEAKLGRLTWAMILDEECAEALGATSVEELRAELVQAAAVAIAWVEAIDRRATYTNPDLGPPFIDHDTYSTGEQVV